MCVIFFVSALQISAGVSPEVNLQGNIPGTGELLRNGMQHLEIISLHARRAGAILKSMLMHSRGGNCGSLKQTELKKLIKEYVKLTFLGMRANKNPNNVNLVFHRDGSLDIRTEIGK